MLTSQQLLNDEEFLNAATLFDSVDPSSVEHYLQECSMVKVSDGDLLLSPDKENGFLYVIVNGVFKVMLQAQDDKPLTVLSRGDCFGEMSMIERRTPSAYVRASGACLVLAIPHDVLWAMVGASHAIARNLLVILSGRIRSDNEMIADSVAIITHFQKKSFTDALTGLNNRRWMKDFFVREIARCQVSNTPLVLAVVDIDHFRSFNNEFGHLVGDLALGTVAEVLSTYFRADDMVVRFGGDEFVVLMPGLALAQAHSTAERVRAGLAIASQKLVESVTGCTGISVSIGLAEMAAEDNLEDLMAKADKALYRSKAHGRDRVSD